MRNFWQSWSFSLGLQNKRIILDRNPCWATNSVFLTHRCGIHQIRQFVLCSANIRSQLCHFDDLMTSLSSSYRARGHRKQIGALGVLPLASSWFNLHLARPFALLVTGCLSIIPSTPLRNLSSTQWSLFSPTPLPPPVGRPDESGVPLFVVLFFAFFFLNTWKLRSIPRGRHNARIAVKRWRKCGGKNGIFDDGSATESKWAFDRLEWPWL